MNDRFGLKEEAIEKITSVFKMYPRLTKAVIYGSRAKGDYKPGSDIDFVVFGNELSLTEILKIETELDDLLLPYQIDLSLISDIEDKDLLDHITRAGQIFYLKKD